MISLFHVTDLHFKNDYQSSERLKLLVDDIQKNIPKNDAYLVFSGDLVNAANEKLYYSLFEKFFVPLDKLFKKIYIVPGNHDIDRNQTSHELSSQYLGDKGLAYLYSPSGHILSNSPFDATSPLAQYHDFENLVSVSQESNFYGWFDPNDEFDIVGFNSTWMSSGRPSGLSDQGRLRVDPPIIDYFAKKMAPQKLKIAVLHHPLDWMDESHSRAIKDKLTSQFDIILTGHVHNPTTSAGDFDGRKCTLLQGPAVKSDYSLGNNAYSIINVDSKKRKYEIIYRAYSTPRNSFVIGEDICENGVKYPDETHKTHFDRLKSSTVGGLMQKHRDGASKINLRDWYKTNFVAKTRARGEFVEPRIRRISFKDGERCNTESTLITEALSPFSERQFVIGPQDSGLTTAAYIFARFMLTNDRGLASVPVYINLEKLQINRASILQEATKGCPAEFSHSQIERLTSDGKITFLFDQIGLPETKKFNTLIETLDQFFPACGAVVFCTQDGSATDSVGTTEIKLDPARDSVFEIGEMTANAIEELIFATKPSATKDEACTLLNNVISSFSQMDEPVYPSSVYILLVTLEQIPDFRPINRVKLLDRYVECLLGRFDLKDVRTGEFNSTEKIKLLSNLAGTMAQTGKASLTHQEWKKFLQEYSTSKMLELPDGLVDEFSNKAILLGGRDRITFRADYLFTYFVAKEMNVNSNLYKYITLDEHFYRFHREIIFFGELEGVDASGLLDSTFIRLGELEEKIFEEYSIRGVDLTAEFENMLNDHIESDEMDVLTQAVETVMESEPSQEAEDVARERDLLMVDRARGVQKRTTINMLEARWYASITTYFQLIKHCTDLDADAKMRHLGKAFGSAELFLQALSAKRGLLSVKSAAMYSGILYVNPLAKTDPKQSLRRFRYDAPKSIGTNLLKYLVNPLLAPAFRKFLDDENEVVSYFARYLMLELPSSPNANLFVKNVLASQNTVLQTCSLEELKGKYLGYGLSGSDLEHYKTIIKGVEKSTLSGKLLKSQTLKKKRMLLDIKENLSKESG